MKFRHVLSVLLVFLLVLSCLAGCSTGSSIDAQAPAEQEWYDGVYDSVENSKSEVTADASGSAGVQNQKLIRTMSLEAETDDLDTLLSKLDARIAEFNGYVENRTVRNGSAYADRRYRYANLTIRVPVAHLDSFIEHINDASNVVSHEETTDDVTLSYVATQSRITALETERDRLVELMEKAETMSDLLLIEQRLTDVLTELEEVTSQLRVYDNLVDYGTVHLSVTEVQKYTVTEEETVWQRISSGFVESLTNLGIGILEIFIFVITRLPYMLPAAVIAGIVIIIVKVNGKKKK